MASRFPVADRKPPKDSSQNLGLVAEQRPSLEFNYRAFAPKEFSSRKAGSNPEVYNSNRLQTYLDMINPNNRKDLQKLATQIEDLGPEVSFNLGQLENYRY
jgi:hypothetical protein